MASDDDGDCDCLHDRVFSPIWKLGSSVFTSTVAIIHVWKHDDDDDDDDDDDGGDDDADDDADDNNDDWTVAIIHVWKHDDDDLQKWLSVNMMMVWRRMNWLFDWKEISFEIVLTWMILFQIVDFFQDWFQETEVISNFKIGQVYSLKHHWYHLNKAKRE